MEIAQHNEESLGGTIHAIHGGLRYVFAASCAPAAKSCESTRDMPRNASAPICPC